MADLFARPEYFAERRNADGSLRFYWKASSSLAERLAGSPHVPVVRLAEDRAAAEEECRAITARVKAYLARGPAAPAPQGPLHSRQVLRATEGLLAHAITEYKTSPKYQRVEPRTKKQYDWILGVIEDWGGACRMSALTYERVQEAAHRLEDAPRTQELFLSLLAMLIDRTAARRAGIGEIVANPARAVLSEIDRPESKGGWIWPTAAVVWMAKAAELLGRPSIATAILLNEWLAQRTGDLLALPRSAYRDGVLHIVQSKTGQYVPLPLDGVGALKARIEWQFAEEAKWKVRTLAAAPTLLLCDTTHEPWKIDHFRHEFARVREAAGGQGDRRDLAKLAEAGLDPIGGFVLDAVPRRLWAAMKTGGVGLPCVKVEELRFGHLRHTGITRLREAGCSDEQIRAISGHSQPSTVYAHYLAVTIETAARAFKKRADFEGR
jgi:integrase